MRTFLSLVNIVYRFSQVFSTTSSVCKVLIYVNSLLVVGVQMVKSYSSTDADIAWKKTRFILSDSSDFSMQSLPSLCVC